MSGGHIAMLMKLSEEAAELSSAISAYLMTELYPDMTRKTRGAAWKDVLAEAADMHHFLKECDLSEEQIAAGPDAPLYNEICTAKTNRRLEREARLATAKTVQRAAEKATLGKHYIPEITPEEFELICKVAEKWANEPTAMKVEDDHEA